MKSFQFFRYNQQIECEMSKWLKWFWCLLFSIHVRITYTTKIFHYHLLLLFGFLSTRHKYKLSKWFVTARLRLFVYVMLEKNEKKATIIVRTLSIDEQWCNKLRIDILIITNVGRVPTKTHYGNILCTMKSVFFYCFCCFCQNKFCCGIFLFSENDWCKFDRKAVWQDG